jgi:hypothetical protein
MGKLQFREAANLPQAKIARKPERISGKSSRRLAHGSILNHFHQDPFMKRPKKTSAAASLPGGVYRHYKGQYYLVLGVAKHSETEEDLVVYVRLYAREGCPLWVRPLANFSGKVIGPKGRHVQRFTPVGSKQPAAKP